MHVSAVGAAIKGTFSRVVLTPGTPEASAGQTAPYQQQDDFLASSLCFQLPRTTGDLTKGEWQQ